MEILAHLPKDKPKITPESIEADLQKKKEKEEENKKDYYAFIRSMVVLVWIATNFVIIALVLETGGVDDLKASTTTDSTDGRSQVFLTVILWIVAFMAGFRLLGTIYYLVSRMVK
jgi:chitin synthase